MTRPTEKELQAKFAESVARVKSMDKIDRDNGNRAPRDVGPAELAAVAACALEAGLRSGDESCLYDALVYLLAIQGKETLDVPY